MTRRTRKGKCIDRKPSKSPAKARKRRGGVSARPKAKRPAAGPLAVRETPLGTVDVLHVKRGAQTYMHVFRGKSPTLHQVEGAPGVLVLRGGFTVDAKGFIHD